MMSTTKRGGVCFQYAKSGNCDFGSRCKFSHDVSAEVGLSMISESSKSSKKQPRDNHLGGPLAPSYIDTFFEEYPDFDYKPTAPIWTEFNRMCEEFGWGSDDYEMRGARRQFKSAMVQQFNDLYGMDEEDLASWQNLCRVLKIEPVPEELKECRERVRKTYVNLVDLVDTPRTGAAVKIFSNLKKLQDYTINNGKYFPKEDAYAGGLLRFLLREILHSYDGQPGKKRRSK